MRLRLLAPALALAALAAAPSAHAAGFKCSASAMRVSVLGQATEPVTANPAGTNCAGDSETLTGAAAGFTGPLSLGALIATTEVFPAKKSVVATGGVADLRVGSLSSLPITLPAVTVPDSVRDAIANALKLDLDLAPVKGLIPAVPDTVQNAANAALNAANLATNTANAVLNAANLATNTANAATNAANLATNTANAATNAANQALNILNAAAILIDPSLALPTNLPTSLPTNLVVDLVTNLPTNLPITLPTSLELHPGDVLPDSIAIDGSGTVNGAINALLPDGKLPSVDLLRIQGALAYAAGACKSGTASVAGSSDVSGIKVLGQELSVGTLIDRTLGLIDTASIDPSSIPLPAIDLGLSPAQLDLIEDVPAAQAALDAAVASARAALQSALDALPTTKVLDATVAQVKVVPGTRFQDANSVTQRALAVTVSIAGQEIVNAIVGEAKVSSAGVDCSDPVTDPAKEATDDGDPDGAGGGAVGGPADQPDSPEDAALQCTTRKLVLVDVLERDGRVKLNGVADTAYAGKTVAIVFEATGKVVARATVGKDGSFATSAPLPPERVRDTNDARYKATLGDEESINLKLRRRMILRSMTYDDGKVTISGRVLPPLAKPLAAITLKRRVSCTKEQVVEQFKPRADGSFRITVKAPRGVGTAVYRMTTKVRVSDDGSGVFETYTLPRAVDLQR
jgi:hypothetical protein